MIIDKTTKQLLPVTTEALAAARTGPRTHTQHETFAHAIPALWHIEERPPFRAEAVPDGLRVAAWNIERGFHIPEARALLDTIGADIALLSEVDLGMARTGNHHVVAELAHDTGAGYIYGVEFVETGRGSPREALLNPHLSNAASLHGNAILSRLRLVDAFLVRLDDGGVWYDGKSGERQRRIGYRNAILARIADAPKRLWVASIHLESSSDADDRATQVRRLIAAIEQRVGNDAVILGGDFNTNTLRSPAGDIAGHLSEIEGREPLFARLREAGYTWVSLNDTHVTQRTRPDGEPKPPFARLDWLFARGIAGTGAATFAAVDQASNALSDHDAVAATFRFERPFA